MNAGQIEDVPIDDARRQHEVMVLAPMRLVQLALPGMRRRGGGRIVNVTSSVGDVSIPFQAWYDAAKQALDALSDALRPEVAGDGVDIVVVQPGAVATPLWAKARAELIARRAVARDQGRYDRAVAALDGIAARGADPDRVAGVVADVLQAGAPRFRYRVGRDAGALGTLGRLVPTSIRDRVVRSVVGR
jgi:NAD(P)-dependent dehydrogenase (short-subunit alcohol dehydrogenase family)